MAQPIPHLSNELPDADQYYMGEKQGNAARK